MLLLTINTQNKRSIALQVFEETMQKENIFYTKIDFASFEMFLSNELSFSYLYDTAQKSYALDPTKNLCTILGNLPALTNLLIHLLYPSIKFDVPINTKDAHCNKKIVQTLCAYKRNIKIPKTYYTTSNVRALASVEKFVGFPCVIKKNLSMQGEDVHLLHTFNELVLFIQDIDISQYLFQEYIPHDHDFRVVQITDEILYVLKRHRGDSWKCNLSQGAKGEMMPIEKMRTILLESSKKITDELYFSIVGNDFIEHAESKEIYFIESNSRPGLGKFFHASMGNNPLPFYNFFKNYYEHQE